MVAGGIGIAPFPFLAQHLLAAGSRPQLLYGARTADDLVARDLPPTEIPTVSFSTATSTGVSLSVVVSSPSWPDRFSPQHRAPPSPNTMQE